MMLLLNPKNYQERNYPDERSKEIMLKTIQWFENKGHDKMKEDFMSPEFTYDFAEFIKEEGIFETLFLPKGYGSEDQYYSTKGFRGTNRSSLIVLIGLKLKQN